MPEDEKVEKFETKLTGINFVDQAMITTAYNIIAQERMHPGGMPIDLVKYAKRYLELVYNKAIDAFAG